MNLFRTQQYASSYVCVHRLIYEKKLTFFIKNIEHTHTKNIPYAKK